MSKLLKQMAKFDIGDKVTHKVFGEGTIVNIAEWNSANLTIIFEDGKKVIKSSFVKLLKQYEQETRFPIISHHPEESKEFE